MSMDQLISSLNWGELGSIIASSAIVSAGVSAVINYFLTMRTMKNEREMRFIENRLGIYSFIIYNLDIIIQWGLHQPSKEGNTPPTKEGNPSNSVGDQIQKIIQSIDNELKNKFYLIDNESASIWMWIKRFSYQVGGTTHTEYMKNIYGMRNKSAQKYNELRPLYKELVRGTLDEIPEIGSPNV
jgi:hypothetical protein